MAVSYQHSALLLAQLWAQLMLVLQGPQRHIFCPHGVQRRKLRPGEEDWLAALGHTVSGDGGPVLCSLPSRLSVQSVCLLSTSAGELGPCASAVGARKRGGRDWLWGPGLRHRTDNRMCLSPTPLSPFTLGGEAGEGEGQACSSTVGETEAESFRAK